MEIIYEDNHLVAVNKLAGEIVQGDRTQDKTLADLVKDYLKEKYKKPGNVFLGVAHRIDRPVTGAVLFCRTSKALARVNEMIKNRQIKKIYWAAVASPPPADCGTLVHYLTRDETQNKSFAHDREVADSQRAELYYKILAKSQKDYCLEIILQTGRHHQIRAQLAKIGCPVVGDVKYGFGRANPDGSICLHSRKMEFDHPVAKTPLAVVVPPPEGAIWDGFLKTGG